MPRHARLEIPGGVYHVITRGIERRAIFCDDNDRKEFLSRFSTNLSHTGSKCYGWTLMPNHFHLLIGTGKASLSELMRKLLTGYAIYFNHRYRRSGYLYQNRYKSILCQEEPYLLELVRYIHLNPLRAKLVTDLSELDHYSWSGHSALMGKQNVPWQSTGEILERFGRTKAESQKRYREFIAAGQIMGKREDLTGGGLKRSAGGWQGVQALKRAKEYWRSDERVLGDGNFVETMLKTSEEVLARKERFKREGWNIETLIKKVCRETGVDQAELTMKGRGNRITEAKALIVYWGKTELGLSGSEIAKELQCSRPAISYLMKCGKEKANGRTLF